MSDEPDKIKITLDDLENVEVHPSQRAFPIKPATQSSNSGDWGSVDSGIDGHSTSETSCTFPSWVRLGLAGGLGAFIAWACCEPFFDDSDPEHSIASIILFPLMIALVSLGITISENISERKTATLPIKILVLLPLAAVIGCLLNVIANLLYFFGRELQFDMMGDIVLGHPVTWIVRAIAWAVFGISGGLIYGISSKSGKKCLYGLIGGVIGAFAGGLLFDPISLLANEKAEISRMVGFTLLGTCTGIAIGLVEGALKDRWLFVQEGPLAGKQFILYKDRTLFGNNAQCDIFLFKANGVQPQHAIIHATAGGEASLEAFGPVSIAGRPCQGGRHTLSNGDLIQISNYTFRYEEKRSA